MITMEEWKAKRLNGVQQGFEASEEASRSRVQTIGSFDQESESREETDWTYHNVRLV